MENDPNSDKLWVLKNFLVINLDWTSGMWKVGDFQVEDEKEEEGYH